MTRVACLGASLASGSRCAVLPEDLVTRNRGDACKPHRRACDLLADAERRCRAQDMLGFAHAAAWRRGRLLDDAELVDSAEAWMASEGIKSPSRFATLLAPGFDSVA